MNPSGLRIYLETTVFNRYFEDGRDYNLGTKRLFDEIKTKEIKAYSSSAVLEELYKSHEPKRQLMLNLVQNYKIEILPDNEAIRILAELYIKSGIIPNKYVLDAVHIATASVYSMDCIISLNFRHINRIKTKIMVESINTINDYSTPFICTPMEVISNGQ